MEPVTLIEVINQAHAAREAARAELANTTETELLGEAAVYAMIDSLGDLGAALKGDKPESLAQLYEELRLQLLDEPEERAVYVEMSPRVVSVRARGGACTLTTRLALNSAIA